MKILVLGSNGQVGEAIKTISASYPKFNFVFAGRADIDLEDPDLGQKIMDEHANYVINCAAYTQVDRAETEVLKSWKINTCAVGRIAQACVACGATLIHLSTDYVYDSNRGLPYRESDPTAPKSVYATTKLSGEVLARFFKPDTLIVRTSWIYSDTGHNFVNTMLNLAQKRKSLTVVNDQFGAPTCAADLASALMKMVEHIQNQGVDQLGGIYNYANEGITTWYDFAREIFSFMDIGIDLQPISTQDYGAKAPRPAWSVMSLARVKNTFHLTIPHWRQSLHKTLTQSNM
ncbi:MAG: dTDP-4-dehydrorhamnose reductase [Saprospiraceae bacterium]|nr:dTDP-4-dehydrorhamnose reductase [Saprospiraceae bacterium]